MRFFLALFAVLVFSTTGCSDARDGAGAPVLGLATTASFVGEVGDTLARRVVVQLASAGGELLVDRQVDVTADDGGVVTPASAQTDASGRAFFLWRLGAVEGTQTLTISAAGVRDPLHLTATAIAPAVAAIQLSLPRDLLGVGERMFARAAVLGRRGQALATAPLSWTSSDPAVASVQPSGDSVAIVALGPGVTTIAARSDTVLAVRVLHVSQSLAQTVGLSLQRSTLFVGGSTVAVATVLDSRGVATPGRSLTWTSQDPTIAAIQGAGDTVQVVAVSPGITDIRVSSDGISSTSVTVSVSRALVASVTLRMQKSALRVSETAPIVADLRDASGAAITSRDVRWQSSDLTVATLTGTGTTALVTAIGPGSAEITATSEEIPSSNRVVVNVALFSGLSLKVIAPPASVPIEPLDTAVVHTDVRDAQNNPVPNLALTWKTSTPAVARLVSLGDSALLIGVAPGAVTVTASVLTVSASAVVTIVPPIVRRIVVTTPRDTLLTQEADSATALMFDKHGVPIAAAAVVWQSSAPTVMEVDGTTARAGLAARTPGITSITASSGTVSSAPKVMVVVKPPVASVQVVLRSPSLLLGQTTRAVATMRDSLGRQLRGRIVAWTPSDPTVATISGSGDSVTVTAVGAGTTSINALSEGKSALAVITVTIPIDVEIRAVFLGGTTTPANLAALGGTVDVQVEIPFAAQRPTSLDIELGGQFAARRVIAANECNATCIVTVSAVQTANYTVNASAGTASPQWLNGTGAFVARVFMPNAPVRSSPLFNVTLANADGYHGILTPPVTSATSASGAVWRGGPTAPLTMQVIPVFYSGRSLGVVSFRFGSGPVVTEGTAPFVASVGVGTTPSYTGYASAGGAETIQITSGLYTTGGATPVTFVAAGQPTSTLVDYAAPTGGSLTLAVSPAAANWLGGTYNFAAGLASPSDAGVGLPSPINPAYERSGCGSAAWTPFAGTAASIGECPSDLTNAAYQARATVVDRLGNAIVLTAPAKFGVDLTPPAIAFTPTSLGSNSVLDATVVALPSPAFDIVASDTRSGVSAGGTSAEHFVVSASPSGATCMVGSGSPGAFPITNPTCAYANGPTAFFFTTSGALAGYFVYQVRVTDRAGNVSTPVRRAALIDNGTPGPNTVAPPGGPIGGSSVTFLIEEFDEAEMREAALSLAYPELLQFTGMLPYLGFPIGTLATSFDDVILGGFKSFALPVPFVRHLEVTTPLDSVNKASTQFGYTPTNVGLRATDFAGHEGLNGSAGDFSGVNPGLSWVEYNRMNLPSMLLSFRILSSISAPFGGLKAQLVTFSGAQLPFDRVDFYVVALWRNLGQPMPCYLSSAGSPNIVDNGVFRLWTWALSPGVANRSCVDASTMSITPGIQVLATGVSKVGDALATRVATLVP